MSLLVENVFWRYFGSVLESGKVRKKLPLILMTQGSVHLKLGVNGRYTTT